MFGRVGRAGLNPIKNRQQERLGQLTPALRASFQLLQDLFKLQPRREFRLCTGKVHRILVASDASYEAGLGKAGFLIVSDPGSPKEVRKGFEVLIPNELYEMWGDQHTYISQLELMVVITVMIQCAPLVRNSRGVWFIDNVAALMALVNGRSNTDSLDQMALLGHLASFALGANSFYEWVGSKSNWSDEISREGRRGKWAPANGFDTTVCTFNPLLLRLPCRAVVTVLEHLG